MVKIISWKAGLVEGASIQRANKITPEEWQLYQDHLLRISKIASVDKVRGKIKETFDAIKKNGGFK